MLVHCARLDLKEDISAFAQRLTKEGNPAVNPAVPALAAMLANNQDLAHACFEASGELSLLSECCMLFMAVTFAVYAALTTSPQPGTRVS